MHLVITFAEECDFKCRARRIQELLTNIPFGDFAVTIEKFTRPWQRFLGSGDVHATADDVASAVEERDVGELVKINPAWKPIMDRGEMHVLPQLLAPPDVLMIEDNR